MKKCNYCNKLLEDDDLYCRYCGKKVEGEAVDKMSKSDGEDGGNKLSSAFLRYSGYLDADALYKVAWAKEHGIVKSEFEGEAEELYKVLAFKGHCDGIYRYACILMARGEMLLAYKWLKIAAEAGHVPSINLLKTHEWNRGSELSAQHSGENGGVEVNSGTVDETPVRPIALPDATQPFAQKVNKVLPSVVMITVTYKKGNRCFISRGSGFVTQDASVVTNAHVIGDAPECIEARFEPSIDSATYTLYPKIVAGDYDIAVLSFSEGAKAKIHARAGVPLRTQPASYGEEVYTIGNPLGIGLSVSKGIVSCPDRSSNYPKKVSSVIQTDITINHGNSGGALFDCENRVIGMATFVPSESEGGIGMCIPSAYIQQILCKA